MSVTLNNQDAALDEEHDEREDWQARPLVCDNERDYWKFWIWLYWLMRAEEEGAR